MYIPFFYYPADEVIFHPVIGFRTREGNFIQTTTYILGRPKADSSSQSSLTRILGNSSDMEKRREGIFLRSTGKKVKDPSATTLKVLVDYYTNLGAYLGTELSTPKAGILNAMDLSLGLGFSRTVIRDAAGNYSPFTPVEVVPGEISYDGSVDWNKANLFSMEVPFRYRFKTASSLGGRFGSLSWSFPYYSDPWVDDDFLDRAEDMDWVHMIQQGAAALEEDTTTENTVGAYQWQLSGQLNPSFPKLAPYISSMGISSYSSTVFFKTRNLSQTLTGNKYPAYYYQFSPSRGFFYPDTISLYSFSAAVSGTPLTLDNTGIVKSNTSGQSADPAAQNAAGAGGAGAAEKEDPLKSVGVPRSPWEKPDGKTAGAKNEAGKLVPPVLGQRFDMARAGSSRFSLDYRIAPTSASELQFRSSETNWPEYSDIDWSEISSILSTVGGDASTAFNLNHTEGLYSNTFTFSGSGSWRQYSYINEEAEAYTTTTVTPLPGGGATTTSVPDPAKIEAAKRQQYSQSFFTTSYGYTTSLRPLFRSTVWGQSNVQYSLKGLIVKSNFTGTGDDPDWELLYGGWEKEKLDTHQIAANLAASVMEKQQTFTLSAELPPREPSISGNATFRAWLTETNAHMRVLNPGEEDKRKFEPFYSTETITLGTWGSLVHYMVLDTELKEFTTITTTLNLSNKLGLSAAYTATRITGYELNKTQGWIPLTGEPSLKSRDFTLNFAKTFSKNELWKKRLGFSVNINSRLFFDLQRYTNSSFSLTTGFGLKISNFIDLNFSTTMENAVIFRYFKDLPMFQDLPIDLPEGEQNNFFIDLANSFRFDDENRRRSSGFKMKSMNLSATHHLGDWNAILSLTMSPYRPEGSMQYQFNNEVSFVVQWIPITEIKSDIKYNKKNDEWIVK
jgi:hypothetical protein